MLLRIDTASNQLLHDQLAGQLRRSIAEGELVPGERLPPARELADSLGINVHTLLRSFQTLRDEGVLEVRRGRGTTVTDRAPGRVDMVTRVRKFIEMARTAGITDQEIMQAVEAQL